MSHWMLSFLSQLELQSMYDSNVKRPIFVRRSYGRCVARTAGADADHSPSTKTNTGNNFPSKYLRIPRKFTSTGVKSGEMSDFQCCTGNFSVSASKGIVFFPCGDALRPSENHQREPMTDSCGQLELSIRAKCPMHSNSACQCGANSQAERKHGLAIL